jgi:hypothetical protein
MLECECWRYAFASVEGTSHVARELPCQDSSECRLVQAVFGDVLVTVISDGAGSASRAEAGSSLACDVFVDRIERHYRSGLSVRDLSDERVKDWLAILATEIKILAKKEGREPRDYACTLLGAVVEVDKAAIFQVGDGAIVVATSQSPDSYVPVFWPQRGEYANLTHFATAEDATLRLDYCQWPDDEHSGSLVEVALLSDGLQSLALDYQARTAHAPFFRPILTRLRAEPAGHSQPVSGLLTSFLGSSRVNERTDDDKTLVIATRRPIASSATAPPVGSQDTIAGPDPQTAESVG